MQAGARGTPSELGRLERQVEEFFAPGGVLARAHPAYEARQTQIDMALEVLVNLAQGGHLVIEAGTGIGKTLAYLVPAVLLRRRVIVSTGTRALQDQLARKDIPFLVEHCGLSVTATTVKGRDNYLCRHRFASFALQPLFGHREEGASWSQVVEWARQTDLGDATELSGVPENPTFWREVNARDASCLGKRCPVHDSCHLHEVRRRAHQSDVVIVNHHLYLADAAVRATQFGEVLPDADLVIFDEAHRLEPAATSFFGRTVSARRLQDLAEDLVRELDRASVEAAPARRRAEDLGRAAASFSLPWGAPAGRQILPARLTGPQEEALALAAGAVAGVSAATRSVPDLPELGPFSRRSEELLADLEVLRSRDDASWVHWYEVRGRGVALTASPVDVSQLLRERIFARLSASVLCSATLAVGGSLGHARQRLGLWADVADGVGDDEPVTAAPAVGTVREAVHVSPFDYASQGLLYLPPRLPDPREPGWATACAAEIAKLVRASRGRAFLLFTSFGNLRRVHEVLAGELPYPVLVQGDAPKHEILRQFMQAAEAGGCGAVLFATASFWEGVDVPGEALSLVVIDRLPFPVPSDPVFAARSRLLEEAGGNSFRDLSLPEAVLTLKQGVGRLIRSHADRGVVALLDTRVQRSRYGRVFLADLPPFTRTCDLADVEEFFA